MSSASRVSSRVWHRRVLLSGGLLLAAAVSHASPGALDTTFGQRYGDDLPGGLYIYRNDSAPVTTSGIDAVTVEPDGRIVAAGWSQVADGGQTTTKFALLRFNDAGLDTTFGQGGWGRASAGGVDAKAAALVKQSGGKYVVVGYGSSEVECAIGQRYEGPCGFALARFTSSGVPDPSFGGTGTGGVLEGVGDAASRGNSRAFGATVLPDGRVVVVGWAIQNGRPVFAVARFSADGILDPSFNRGAGRALTPIGDAAEAHYVLRQGDGSLVVVGQATKGSDSLFALARYTADGGIDSSFNPTGANGDAPGTVTTDVGSGDRLYAYATGVVAQGDKIVVLGWGARRLEQTKSDFFVYRYDAAGRVDPTFGPSTHPGYAVVSGEGESFDIATAIAQQPDGRLVVVGASRIGSCLGTPSATGACRLDSDCGAPPAKCVEASWFLLQRLLPDGVADPTFGPDGNGKVLLPVLPLIEPGTGAPPLDGGWYNVALQPSDAANGSPAKIVTVGIISWARDNFVVGRFIGGPECGDGVTEPPFESCDHGPTNGAFGDCCSSACRIAGQTQRCGISTHPCINDDFCDGNAPVCRIGGFVTPGTAICSDGDACTVEDSCDGAGGCSAGVKICEAKPDPLKRSRGFKVTCLANAPGTCTAEILAADEAQAFGAGIETAASGPACAGKLPPPGTPAGDLVNQSGKPRNFVRQGRKGLKYRTVLKLKLNKRGRALLQECGALDFSARLSVATKSRAEPIVFRRPLPRLLALLRRAS